MDIEEGVARAIGRHCRASVVGDREWWRSLAMMALVLRSLQWLLSEHRR
jgi:hypothetical protein